MTTTTTTTTTRRRKRKNDQDQENDDHHHREVDDAVTTTSTEWRFQQQAWMILQTQLYHWHGRRLDQLVHDFFVEAMLLCHNPAAADSTRVVGPAVTHKINHHHQQQPEGPPKDQDHHDNDTYTTRSNQPRKRRHGDMTGDEGVVEEEETATPTTKISSSSSSSSSIGRTTRMKGEGKKKEEEGAGEGDQSTTTRKDEKEPKLSDSNSANLHAPPSANGGGDDDNNNSNVANVPVPKPPTETNIMDDKKVEVDPTISMHQQPDQDHHQSQATETTIETTTIPTSLILGTTTSNTTTTTTTSPNTTSSRTNTTVGVDATETITGPTALAPKENSHTFHHDNHAMAVAPVVKQLESNKTTSTSSPTTTTTITPKKLQMADNSRTEKDDDDDDDDQAAFFQRYQMISKRPLLPPPITNIITNNITATTTKNQAMELQSAAHAPASEWNDEESWPSRLVLPVTIWPCTTTVMAPLQHALDRQYWMQCWVAHRQQQQQCLGGGGAATAPVAAAVVWLQGSHHLDDHDYDWPKEELIRQLWKIRVPSLSYSRRQWSRMTLSDLLQLWARHYYYDNYDYDDSKDPPGTIRIQPQPQPTIQILWDPHSCPIHSQFWTWLVEQRCQHGVPIEVTLLEDSATAQVLYHHQPPQYSTTLPSSSSCAAHVHIRSAVTSFRQLSPPQPLGSWLDRLIDFGLAQLYSKQEAIRRRTSHHKRNNQACGDGRGGDDHHHQDDTLALGVVLHWLLHRKEQKRRFHRSCSANDPITESDGHQNDQQHHQPQQQQQSELIPLLLHWKKEWATELSQIAIALDDDDDSDNHWSQVVQDTWDLATSRSPTARLDLLQRLRYMELLRRRQRRQQQPYRRSTECHDWSDHDRANHSLAKYARERSVSWLALRFQRFLQNMQQQPRTTTSISTNTTSHHNSSTTNAKATTTWTEEHRRKILMWLVQEREHWQRQQQQTKHHHGQIVLDCIHEWMILVDHCSNLSEFQQCVDDRTLLPGSQEERKEFPTVGVVTQVRRETVASLTWKDDADMPESLVSRLTTNNSNHDNDDDQQQQEQQQQQRQRLLSQWALQVAPAALYQTLQEKATVSHSEWFRDLVQRILGKIARCGCWKDFGDDNNNSSGTGGSSSSSSYDWLLPVFQYAVRHLRLMGLVKELPKRGGSDSFLYEKIALVFCGGGGGGE
ncbi:hypothetical protein ACA910_009634 [Epithemia clementina (nom. ined.)]